MIDISELLKRVSGQDAIKLKVLHNAVVKTTKAYQEDPVASRHKDWKLAEAALEEEAKRLSVSPDQESDGGPDDLLDSKLEVWRFLRDDGWKISRSQFYEHCSDGLLRPDKSTGKYSLKAIDKYAKLNLRQEATGEKVNDQLSKFQEKKVKIELEQAEIRLEKEKHDLGIKLKKFIPREEFELAIVGRAVALMAHLKHMAMMRAGDYIALVEGDQKRQPELTQLLIDDIELRLSDFARDVEFDVILESD